MATAPTPQPSSTPAQRRPLGRVVSLLIATALGGGGLLAAALLVPDWVTSAPCRFLSHPLPSHALSASDLCRCVLVWGGHLVAGLVSGVAYMELNDRTPAPAGSREHVARLGFIATAFTAAYLLVSLLLGIAAVYAVLHVIEPLWTLSSL